MDAVTSIPFIVALVAGIIRLLYQREDYKVSYLFIVVTIIAGVFIGIFYSYLDAFITSTTYTLETTTLTTYILEAFIASVIVPIGAWLARAKFQA